MSSIMDQVIQIAEESTYGTFVSPTRAYEGKADTFTRDTMQLDSVGLRRNLQTLRSDRSDTITLGATGSIETDVLTKGHGLLLKHLLGTSAIAQQGATAAYLQTFNTNDVGPATSYTTQVSRVDSGGVLRTFSYNGCMATGLNITQNLDEALKLTIDFKNIAKTVASFFKPIFSLIKALFRAGGRKNDKCHFVLKNLSAPVDKSPG